MDIKLSDFKVGDVDPKADSLFPCSSTAGTALEDRKREGKRKIWTALTHVGVLFLVMGVFITCFIFAPLMPLYIRIGGWSWFLKSIPQRRGVRQQWEFPGGSSWAKVLVLVRRPSYHPRVWFDAFLQSEGS
jgi:hypothetical protein